MVEKSVAYKAGFILDDSVFKVHVYFNRSNLLPFSFCFSVEVEYLLFFVLFTFFMMSGVIISCHLRCMFS